MGMGASPRHPQAFRPRQLSHHTVPYAPPWPGPGKASPPTSQLQIHLFIHSHFSYVWGTVLGTKDNTGYPVPRPEDWKRPLSVLIVYRRDGQQPHNLANKMTTDCHQSRCGGVVSREHGAWDRGASFGSGGQERPLWEGDI